MRNCFITAICISFVFILTIGQPARSEVYGGSVSILPSAPRFTPIHKIAAYCVDVLNWKELPCPWQVSLEGIVCERSNPAETTLCGHVDAEHTPPSRNSLPESQKVSVLGGFTDQWQQTPKTSLPLRTMTPQNPIYKFDYYSGQLSGAVLVRAFAASPPPGYRFVSPCETAQSCTSLKLMNVEVNGFVQLPSPMPLPATPPPWDDDQAPPDDTWDGYVRCGFTAGCPEPVADNPCNWPAHPHVHWGQPSFVENLRRLAQLWYMNCCQPLVITDISLPKGGLFDIGEEGQPPNWQPPHATHRFGINADVSRKSVPVNPVATCNCGPRPADGTFDKTWLKTRLLEFANDCGLETLERDPGHLQPESPKPNE